MIFKKKEYNRIKSGIRIVVAEEQHLRYVDEINETIEKASLERGTGIARRTHEYIASKITEGKAIIAIDGDRFAGFCYIESWNDGMYVANSGLIVHWDYRGQGLARSIKLMAFELSRKKFPNARLFGLTTGLAVMKINSELGYRPVTFSELTDDEQFWKGCQSCVNYDILIRMNKTKCLCTGMIYDPAWEVKKYKPKTPFRIYREWLEKRKNEKLSFSAIDWKKIIILGR
jgi:GNAT superfamily N-acetyltransferase